jgi:hypothetical protein
MEHVMAPPRIDPLTRFTAKYEVKPSGCWEWTGATSNMNRGPTGNWRYGMFRPGGRVNDIGAHRWAYVHHKGKIPPGMVLDHLCRNPLCVNPDHLEPVTNKTNLARGFNANAAKTECKRGHKFTPENTRIGKRGNRICRRCKAWHASNAYHSKRAL